MKYTMQVCTTVEARCAKVVETIGTVLIDGLFGYIARVVCQRISSGTRLGARVGLSPLGR